MNNKHHIVWRLEEKEVASRVSSSDLIYRNIETDCMAIYHDTGYDCITLETRKKGIVFMAFPELKHKSPLNSMRWMLIFLSNDGKRYMMPDFYGTLPGVIQYMRGALWLAEFVLGGELVGQLVEKKA